MSAVGTYLTDGTVTWIIEDATQADAVGDITLHPTLLAGHILANGATVTASEYPRLLAWVQENSMTGTDDAHYTYDESADTLKLPNAVGRVLQGAASLAAVAAGLPNIIGTQASSISDPYGELPFKCVGDAVNATGAFYADLNTDNTYFINWHNITGVGNYAQSYKTYYRDNFDASRSNAIYGNSTTVQPPAITMLAQIKY